MSLNQVVFEKSEQAGREYNQDRFATYFSDDNDDLFVVVADGVGGTKDGALGAKIIAESSEEFWQNRSEHADAETFLNEFFSYCNQKIKLSCEQDLNTASTLVALMRFNNKVVSAHAGDSRIYQFNDKEKINQSKDHSLAYAKFLMGEINEQELATHPSQTRLLNCLDGSEDMQCELNHWQLSEGEHFVLCTDGFWEIFNDNQIIELLNSENREFIFANRLDDQLQNDPKHDNTTVVFCRLTPAEVKTLAPAQGDTETQSVSAPIVPVTNRSNLHKHWKMGLISLALILVIYLIINSILSSSEPIASNETSSRQAFSNQQLNSEIQSVDSDNGDETNAKPNNETNLNDNLLSASDMELEISPGEDPITKLESQLILQGHVSTGSKLDKQDEMIDQYAEIITVQLMVKGTPVYGAILRYKKTDTGLKVISGKVSNLPDVADKPQHDFNSCFAKYQEAQLINEQTVVQGKDTPTLYIDAASSGYFWLTEILVKESAKAYDLYLLDSGCEALRLVPRHVSR